MTKLIIRLKGGKGSGFYGHSGRPGKVGGSSPYQGSIDAVRSIYNDEQMRRIAVGLMADGGVDDLTNVTGLVGGQEFSEYVAENSFKEADKLFSEYEEAVGQEGYYVKGSISEERLAWERYYYGREVRGFQNGERFAQKALSEFLKSGKKPKNEFSTAKKPGKKKVQRHIDPWEGFSEEDRMLVLNDDETKYWTVENPTPEQIRRFIAEAKKRQ